MPSLTVRSTVPGPPAEVVGVAATFPARQCRPGSHTRSRTCARKGVTARRAGDVCPPKGEQHTSTLGPGQSHGGRVEGESDAE